MTFITRLSRLWILAIFLLGLVGEAAAQDAEPIPDGTGVDSQLLWPTPGPSNFPTLMSSDIANHKEMTFAALFSYSRKPLGVENPNSNQDVWMVKDVFYADFMWGFGIVDVLQVGLVVPIVIDQSGTGVEPFKPDDPTDITDYSLSSSALRDIRFNVKTRFLGGKAENPDQRDIGLALDVGLAVPSGDEKNFAGDEGVVLFPTLIFDFHRCMVSAGLNAGARFRFKQSEKLYNVRPGHQGTLGIGVTGHLVDRRLLLSAEGIAFAEFEEFERFTVEYRGGIGYIPDKGRSVSLWLSAGSSAGSDELLGAPLVRVLLGITYAPKEAIDDWVGM
jgi:hypothetical protein